MCFYILPSSETLSPAPGLNLVLGIVALGCEWIKMFLHTPVIRAPQIRIFLEIVEAITEGKGYDPGFRLSEFFLVESVA
jgi:hypothetical protein